MSARAATSLTLVLWLAVAIAALQFVWATMGVLTRHSDGFAAYYTGARLVRDGQGGPRFYDDTWFGGQVSAFVPGVKDIYNANPPTTSMIMLPLSWANYATARTIWILCSVIMLVATLPLIVRETGMSGPVVPLFVSVTLLCEPLAANMRQGQVYVALLMLATLVWIGFRRHRDGLSGSALGVMLVLKTAGALLPVLFIVRRRWMALCWSIVVAVAIAALSLLSLGLVTWRTYLTALIRLRGEPDLSVTAYQTTTSVIRHLFTFDAVWNPQPVVQAPALASALTVVVALAIVGVSTLAALHSSDGDLAFGALLTATIILSPVSLDYHYTLLLLPFAIVLARIQALRSWWQIVALATSALLLFADLPNGSSRFDHGVWVLLEYPKLAGGLLLWGQSLWLMTSRVSVTAVESRLRSLVAG